MLLVYSISIVKLEFSKFLQLLKYSVLIFNFNLASAIWFKDFTVTDVSDKFNVVIECFFNA
jgi:hypothetical protein